MKIIAFIMVLWLVSTVFTEAHAFRDQTYEVLGETVHITRLSDRTLSIEIGEHTHHLGGGDVRYYANEATTDGEHFIVFGYVIDPSTPTFYDAFIFIVDDEGDTVYDEVLDFGELEETVALIDVDGTWMFRINKSSSDGHNYVFEAVFFLVFNEDYTDFEKVRVDTFVQRMEIIDGALYLSDTYHGPFHTFVTPQPHVYRAGEVAGLQDGDDGVMTLRMIGEAILDGVVHENHLTIEEAGHYTLVHEGVTHALTLEARVEGIEDGGVYTGEVAIVFSSGTAHLNGERLAYGESVSCVGHHTLIVRGKNGYEKTLNFTIESGVMGVEDGAVYGSPVTIHFAGEGTLNGMPFKSGTRIEASGEHTLTISGTNGYAETVAFEITPSPTPVATTLMIVEIALVAIAVALIGVLVFFALKKKHPRPSS